MPRPIASAVILPAQTSELSTAPPKRSQSSSSDSDSSKRPRLDSDGNALSQISPKKSPAIQVITPEITEVSNSSARDESRRRSSVFEEKKRGQRLFGGLLSTLSQSTQNGQHKRRHEIQKRQYERSKTQKAQNDVPKDVQIKKLNEIRKQEQIKFDEDSMHIRHNNMRAMANFLCTMTEPKLYYRPWELLPEQKECIKSQIASVSEVIERELSDAEQRYKRSSELEEEESKANQTSKEREGQPRSESPNFAANNIANNMTINVPQSLENKKTKVDEVEGDKEEHIGEVMVENEEDTVIY